VLQISSRREANDVLTWPQFEENLRTLFPDLETLPHADTLFRLLRDMGETVQEIEQALIDLVQKLIRQKKFRRFLINNSYPIALDGCYVRLSTRRRLIESPENDEVERRNVA